MNTADENLSADRFILLVLADFFELVARALRVIFPVLKMLRSVTEAVKALGSIFRHADQFPARKCQLLKSQYDLFRKKQRLRTVREDDQVKFEFETGPG